jgi:hypothetical protein
MSCLSRDFSRVQFSFLILITCVGLGSVAHSQTAPLELQPVNVTGRPAGEELVGPYNQPRWSARGRFSSETDVYVLPPYSFFIDLDYHGTFPRRGKPDHLFVQEFELGLPYRFQVAFEVYEERQNGRAQVPFTLIEGRYAFADWGKILLNPTILVEYRFGIGDLYPTEIGGNRETEIDSKSSPANEDQPVADKPLKEKTTKSFPNGYEVRLLLGQEIAKSIEFAANIFYDQDTGGDRETEIGFSTATSYALRGEALKVGIETSYRNTSQKGERSKSKNIFEIGPSFTFKPSPRHPFRPCTARWTNQRISAA